MSKKMLGLKLQMKPKKRRENDRMGAIYKKELKSFFSNVTGFVFIAFFLVVLGIYAGVINFIQGSSQYEFVYYNISFVFLVAIPILTMRSFSEERKQKTDQLLFSLPISTVDIVLGKYFAMLTVFAIPVAISCLYPLLLSFFDPAGYISYLSIYSTAFAFFLLGSALISIGMLMSSVTENQIIAAVLSFGAVFICYMMSSLETFIPSTSSASLIGLAFLNLIAAILAYFFTKSSNIAWILFVILEIPVIVISFVDPTMLEGLLPTILGALSVFGRFNSFSNAIFDISSIVYFVSVAVLFNVFTIHSFDKRRWS